MIKSSLRLTTIRSIIEFGVRPAPLEFVKILSYGIPYVVATKRSVSGCTMDMPSSEYFNILRVLVSSDTVAYNIALSLHLQEDTLGCALADILEAISRSAEIDTLNKGVKSYYEAVRSVASAIISPFHSPEYISAVSALTDEEANNPCNEIVLALEGTLSDVSSIEVGCAPARPYHSMTLHPVETGSSISNFVKSLTTLEIQIWIVEELSELIIADAEYLRLSSLTVPADHLAHLWAMEAKDAVMDSYMLLAEYFGCRIPVQDKMKKSVDVIIHAAAPAFTKWSALVQSEDVNQWISHQKSRGRQPLEDVPAILRTISGLRVIIEESDNSYRSSISFQLLDLPLDAPGPLHGDPRMGTTSNFIWHGFKVERRKLLR